ncbi:hypothetical protein O9992_28710 [Vibrio lentus]|nr:hypothetical protein [Vibrio lentus]
MKELVDQELIATKQTGYLQVVTDANIELNDELLETTDLFQSKRWLRVSSRSLTKHGRILYAIKMSQT